MTPEPAVCVRARARTRVRMHAYMFMVCVCVCVCMCVYTHSLTRPLTRTHTRTGSDEDVRAPTLRSRTQPEQAKAGDSSVGTLGDPFGLGARQGKGRGRGGKVKGARGNKPKAVDRAASPPGVELDRGHEDWCRKGSDVEVNWESDWWQASVKRIKASGGVEAAGQGHVLVSYVGGTAEDDEWIAIESGRLRKPQDDFDEDREAEGDGKAKADPAKNKKTGSHRAKDAAGEAVGGDDGGGGGGTSNNKRKSGGGFARSSAAQDPKWLLMGDEIVELLADGPLAEQNILERVGCKDTKRKRKLQALQHLVDGDFLVRQGAGTLGDPHRYFVPDEQYEEGSTLPWVNPNAQLAQRLQLQLQQGPGASGPGAAATAMGSKLSLAGRLGQAPVQVKGQQRAGQRGAAQQQAGGAGGSGGGGLQQALQQQRSREEEALQAIIQQTLGGSSQKQQQQQQGLLLQQHLQQQLQAHILQQQQHALQQQIRSTAGAGSGAAAAGAAAQASMLQHLLAGNGMAGLVQGLQGLQGGLGNAGNGMAGLVQGLQGLQGGLGSFALSSLQDSAAHKSALSSLIQQHKALLERQQQQPAAGGDAAAATASEQAQVQAMVAAGFPESIVNQLLAMQKAGALAGGASRLPGLQLPQVGAPHSFIQLINIYIYVHIYICIYVCICNQYI